SSRESIPPSSAGSMSFSLKWRPSVIWNGLSRRRTALGFGSFSFAMSGFYTRPGRASFCRPKRDYHSPVTHEDMMDAALELATRARDAGEVPIGAVVLMNDEIVGRGFNQPISAGDPTAHAEIVAIRDAAKRVSNYRLTGATLYVTVEPCLMCVGAMVHARIATLVFGAAEPRTGAVTSTVRGGELPGHNHRFDVIQGVREEECRGLM